MGDEVGPNEPTRLGPVTEPETQSSYAWGLNSDDAEMVKQPRTFTLGQIVTVGAVVASLAVVVGAAVLIGYNLRNDSKSDSVATSPTGLSTSRPTLVPVSTPPAPPGSPVALPPPRTSTVTVRAPIPVPSGRTGTYTTIIGWAGAACIDVRYPDANSMVERSYCDPSQSVTVHHTAHSGELVGGDPIIGHATGLACQVISDATQAVLFSDSGTAGDGHDINCIVAAP